MNGADASERFLAMIRDHKGIIYKIAGAYSGDPEERKDLVQDIIFQLWRSFHSYTAEYQYSTWIYRVALNTAISFLRRESRRKQTAGPYSEAIIEMAESPYPDEKEEKIDLLQQFISDLKELDKALMLLYLEEKSYREIAQVMGITETNVATRISRIKSILKEKFSNKK